MPNLNLLVLMYHKIFEPTAPDLIKKFEAHLKYLSQHFSLVLPNDPLDSKRLNICLTFDDAYYDFYSHVFPLLQQYQAKALLAVPTSYILDNTSLSSEMRLSVPYPRGMHQKLFETHAPFCTWQELKAMAKTPYVELASHSHTHIHLARELYTEKDFERELQLSKQLIETHTEVPVQSFVYPFGNFSRNLDKKVHSLYPYTFRIGSALNASWQKGLFYRVDATPFWLDNLSLCNKKLNQYKRQYYWNRIRLK